MLEGNVRARLVVEMSKLLVIGLDGYEASVGDRLMQAGKLPALAALTRRAARIHLDHGKSKRTGLAWEHFASGRAPDGAGRWSAVDFDPSTYRCIQKGTAFTPFPAKLEAKTVVFDPPYFDIARAPRIGGVVSWGAHDPGTKPRANPPALMTEIHERFGPYPAERWIYGFTWPNANRTKQMAHELGEGVRRRERAARWLLTERLPDWDLGIVVVSELHSAAEALWHGIDDAHPLHAHPSAELARAGVEQLYEAVDSLVGSLVGACPDAAVLAFSMHGMGPNESDAASMALLAELMYRRRFGTALLRVPNTRAEVAPGVPNLEEHEDWRRYVLECFAGRPPDGDASLSRSARARAHVPAGVKEFLKRLGLFQSRPITSSIGWMPAAWYCRYWPDMDAFALPSFYDGQIRINLEGREANGRVARADYERICDAVEQDLRACVDPRTGVSVVREIERNHRDDPSEIGPTEADLVVVWEGSPLAFVHPKHGLIGPLPYRRTGGHTGAHGIALMAGTGIVPGEYGTRGAFDVVPTICDYFAGPGTGDIDGASFLGMVTRGSVGRLAG
jgi:predicted AlkP superfamily phosphohydrolase/phosphomutase